VRHTLHLSELAYNIYARTSRRPKGYSRINSGLQGKRKTLTEKGSLIGLASVDDQREKVILVIFIGERMGMRNKRAGQVWWQWRSINASIVNEERARAGEKKPKWKQIKPWKAKENRRRANHNRMEKPLRASTEVWRESYENERQRKEWKHVKAERTG
jgi:hypothetical protein